MTQSFDEFPVYDPLIEYGTNKMSPIWRDFMATFRQNLGGYLSEYGSFMPQLTTAQRDSIQTPQPGQQIFNTTINSAQYFKVIANVGTWISF